MRLNTLPLVCALCFLSCMSPIDHAGDRLDGTVDRATKEIAAVGVVLLEKAGDEARKTVDHALDGAASRATALVDLSVAKATALVDKPVAAVTSKMTKEDRDDFDKRRAADGIGAAVAEYWFEILTSVLGVNGLAAVKYWLTRRRARRAETLASATVQAIEVEGSKRTKERVHELVKESREPLAIEKMIRKFSVGGVKT